MTWEREHLERLRDEMLAVGFTADEWARTLAGQRLAWLDAWASFVDGLEQTVRGRVLLRLSRLYGRLRR